MTESVTAASLSRSGGCLCGQFRFTVSGEPEAIGICHCKDCQRESGSAYSIMAVFDNSGVLREGTLSSVMTTGQSGRAVKRSFCPECGSRLMSEAEFFPGKSLIKCGSFEDTSWVKPVFSLYCESAQSWQTLPETPLAFPGMFTPPAPASG